MSGYNKECFKFLYFFELLKDLIFPVGLSFRVYRFISMIKTHTKLAPKLILKTTDNNYSYSDT